MSGKQKAANAGKKAARGGKKPAQRSAKPPMRVAKKTMSADPLALPIAGRQLIEASAGTGKTYAITNLYARLILGRNLPAPLSVDRILALTFTNAATRELRGRISGRLRDARAALRDGESEDAFLRKLAQSSEDPARDIKLLSGALQLMDEASIMTIHGFCSNVLSEESFEAGQLFEQELTLDGEAFNILAAQDVFRSELLTLPPLQRRAALELWPTPEDLLQLSRGLLRHPNAQLAPEATELNLDEAALSEKIRAAQSGWFADDLPGIIRAANLRARSKPLTRLPLMSEFCRAGDLNPFSELWAIYNGAALEQARKKDSAPLEHAVLALIDNISRCRSAYGALRVNLWHRLLRALRARTAELKAAQHAMTPDDLLIRLRDALQRDGAGLAERLAERWPVMLVDEFQDTDDTQTAIFDRIAAAKGSQALLMVGDPKQAIYQFRGADIYTYLNARRKVKQPRALEYNWRSTAPMVGATNHLFAGKAVFDAGSAGSDAGNHAGSKAESDAGNNAASKAGRAAAGGGEIQCIEARAAERDIPPLHVRGAAPKPCQVLLAGFDDDPPPTFTEVRERLMDAAARQTAELLSAGPHSGATLGGEPLAAGNIAFLVRSRTHAREARKALAANGIQSVYLTQESVLLQDTADDLALILQAALEPRNDGAVKAALAARLMQSRAEDIDALNRDVAAQQAVFAEFQHYHELWQEKNIGAMLMALIEQRQLAAKWLGLADGERQLTNLRHLMELLQTRAAAAPGMRRLLKWFMRERQTAGAAAGIAADERQLRLESDEHLVKIVTMHAAKGLQYDVAMIPCPYFSSPLSKKEPLLYHRKGKDGLYRLIADVGDARAGLAAAQAERYAEDMRLLYVAMTRAKHLCYLGMPLARNWGAVSKTAMAELLGLREVEPDADSVRRHLQSSLPRDLFALVEERPPGKMPTARAAAAAAPPEALSEPPPMPRIHDAWRLHSYTSARARLRSLERSGDAGELPAAARAAERVGYADDDAEPAALDDVADAAGAEVGAAALELSRFTFPRGPRVGIQLHSWLEDVDFTADGSEHIEPCRAALERLGLGDAPAWQPVMQAWLKDILATPLAPVAAQENNMEGEGARGKVQGASAGGKNGGEGAVGKGAGKSRGESAGGEGAGEGRSAFTLGAIKREDRVDELEFHFPVSRAEAGFRLLQSHGYLQNRNADAAGRIDGMLTGQVDLAFRIGGKYYLADYKSNHLGMGFSDYSPAALQEAMQDNLYDLQYLLYTAAFHRHLARALPDYDYDAHFGGVFYLFLRGMDGASAGSGVFFDRPAAELIRALDGKLSGHADSKSDNALDSEGAAR